jgi:NAD(P) transhydrogenase subunit alpha
MDMGILLFLFILVGILGFELLTRVPSQLHTPLMSGTNAISGVVVLGALAAASQVESGAIGRQWIVDASILLAMVNVVGGYFVTDRMLLLFSGKKS